MSDGKLYEAGITNVFNLPRTVKCTVYVTSQPIQDEPNADDEYPSPKGLDLAKLLIKLGVRTFYSAPPQLLPASSIEASIR
jgi:hypothetical protein